MVGRRARCAACHLSFVVPPPKDDKAAAGTLSKADEPDTKQPEHVGFECRVCGSRMFGFLHQVGQQLKCGDCGALTVVPPPPKPKPKNIPAAMEGEQYELWDPDEQPLPSEILAAQPKYVSLPCTKCGTLMHANERQVGQRVPCPDCGNWNVVPLPRMPVAKKRVLSSDAPGLDPRHEPAPRPLIQAPVSKMVHEEEQESEYAHALEKSKRTGKAMEVDARGRPIMPRWPLVTGVLSFLVSRGVLVRWLVYSLVWMVYDAIATYGISAIGTGGDRTAQSMAAVMGVCFMVLGFIICVFWSAGLSAIFFAIITESSVGNREIHAWPGPEFMSWFPELFHVLFAGAMSIGPGWALALLTPDEPLLTAAFIGASVVLSFPIMVLSQLDQGSMFGILSFRVLLSLARCPLSWVMFYLESFALFAGCIAIGYFVPHVLCAPIFVMAVFLYARLLGRLGWKLAESMPIGVS
jgi:DNA-directed RNA polymerase subunit RPC12/RpoP